MKLDEYWVGFDALPNYAVSNYGRVINVNTGRELKQTMDGNGYMKVVLYHKGIRHYIYVHRLVAKAFFLKYTHDHEVKHISEHKHDNSVLNLTLSERHCRTGETLW